ncbi:hypothetical protein ACTFIW_001003 [Dictyostelium discoideum]
MVIPVVNNSIEHVVKSSKNAVLILTVSNLLLLCCPITFRYTISRRWVNDNNFNGSPIWKELGLPNFCQEVVNGLKVHLIPNFKPMPNPIQISIPEGPKSDCITKEVQDDSVSMNNNKISSSTSASKTRYKESLPPRVSRSRNVCAVNGLSSTLSETEQPQAEDSNRQHNHSLIPQRPVWSDTGPIKESQLNWRAYSRILQCKSGPPRPSFRDVSQIIVQSNQELQLETEEGSVQSNPTSIRSNPDGSIRISHEPSNDQLLHNQNECTSIGVNGNNQEAKTLSEKEPQFAIAIPYANGDEIGELINRIIYAIQSLPNTVIRYSISDAHHLNSRCKGAKNRISTRSSYIKKIIPNENRSKSTKEYHL